MKKVVKKAFTLVEIMVALTIFSIIMISVMSIYIVSSEVTYNSEINRALQENIKNIVMEISEDVMKNGINWLTDQIDFYSCTFWVAKLPNIIEDENKKNDVEKWDKFCSWKNMYFLWTKSSDWTFSYSSNPCDDKKSECYLLRYDWANNSPLTNNLVTVRDVKFIVTNNWKKKVTILLKLQPSIKAWFKSSVVENNIFYLQTTLTERHNINK